MNYIGEIRMFAGNFPPAGWAFCDGQLMPISENQTLFNLIGTTYGGDGENTFQLPNLQSRVPIHQGTGPDGTTYQIGEQAGTEEVTLTVQQIPNHTHPMRATNDPGNAAYPADKVAAAGTQASILPYGDDAPLGALNAGSVTIAGGSQPHTNLQPFLCINFIIALYGIYPSQT